ncbi:hypothetical protein ABZ885_31545, partial [Kitasatospora sp. NPDC047058]
MGTEQTVAPDEATARWRVCAAATGPAERAEVEGAVRVAYRAAGLAGPAEVRWFGSPASAAVAALELRAAGAVSVREAVRTAPWEAARRQAVERAGAAGWAPLWALTGGELGPVTNALADRIRNAVLDRLAPEPGAGEEPDDGVEAVRDSHRRERLFLVAWPSDAEGP